MGLILLLSHSISDSSYFINHEFISSFGPKRHISFVEFKKTLENTPPIKFLFFYNRSVTLAA
ncbi:MAG: hypothetical protein COA93_00855 [Alphaproteobacteria bacterium]|nr:MAG: hypothetical protein COA93_00855 [Alphaproteobacteria bacterium]